MVSLTIVNVLAAFLVLLLAVVAGKILSNIVKRVLKSLEVSRVVNRELHVKIPFENYLAGIVRYVLYFVGVIYALQQIGVSTRTLEILFIGFLAILVIFIILAVKDYIPNMIAGVYLWRTQKIKKGEYIMVKNVEGEVLHIGLMETKVKTKDEVVFIPNTLLNKGEVRKKD